MSEPSHPSPTPGPESAPQAQTPDATSAVAEGSLDEQVVAVLKTVFDPEIPVNIYELGLIYDVNIDEERNVGIKMTLTSPACPVAGTLPGDVQARVQGIADIGQVDVEVVWDPAWNPSMMSEAAKLELGLL